MSKQIKSYAEKHKFGCLDKSKKTKKVSIKKPKKKTKLYNGGYINFNSIPIDFTSQSVPYIFRDDSITLDPFAKKEHIRFVYDEITGISQEHEVIQDNKVVKEIDVIEELEYLSMQLYDHVDIERFINENPCHISRYVSLDNLKTDSLNQEQLFNKYMYSIMSNTNSFKAFYTDNTPLTGDVLIDFLINTLRPNIKNNTNLCLEGYVNEYHVAVIKERIISNMIDDLIRNNINKCINLYKEYKHQLNILTLRDLCFFIYGIKGLQLFDTLQILGIDHCSFEFWNNIRDGILLERTTNLNTPEPLPEIEFEF